jgi:hypothetical protein
MVKKKYFKVFEQYIFVLYDVRYLDNLYLRQKVVLWMSDKFFSVALNLFSLRNDLKLNTIQLQIVCPISYFLVENQIHYNWNLFCHDLINEYTYEIVFN